MKEYIIKKSHKGEDVAPHLHKQDLSGQLLREYYDPENGYDRAIFVANPACCDECNAQNGQEYEISELIEAPFDAPLNWVSGHVGCNCVFRLYSSMNSELSEIEINAGDTFASLSPRDKFVKRAIDFKNIALEYNTPKEFSENIQSQFGSESQIIKTDELDIYETDINRELVEELKKEIQGGNYDTFLHRERIDKAPAIRVEVTSDGYKVVDGNHRLLASKELGIEYVPVEIINYGETELPLNVFYNKTHKQIASLSPRDKNIKASIVDYPKESLPDDLWDQDGDEYKLKPEIKELLMKYADEALRKTFGDYKKFFKGLKIGSSVGTQFHVPSSDLDVKVIVDRNFSEDVDNAIKRLRENKYEINNRPVDWYIYKESDINSKDFLNKYDSFYDVISESWDKEPLKIEIDEFPREEILSRARDEAVRWAEEVDLQIGETKRHTMDYDQIAEHLKSIDKTDRVKFKEEIEKILLDIESEIEKLSDKKTDLTEERHEGFKAEFEPDIEKYLVSINWTKPNLKFKLVQKWNYLNLIRELEKLIEDDGKITEDEIPEVEKIIREGGKLSENDNEPTREMEDFFEKRTEEHIDRVQKNMKRLSELLPDVDKDEIDKRAGEHDASKYKEPERTPYVYVTWDYKCKDDKVDFDIPESIKDEMNKATETHVKQNAHHPEYHSSKEVDLINREDRDKPPKEMIDATSMKDIDIIEMVADWVAMSQEKGTNTIDWADKNVNVRWKFNDDQKDRIYELIDLLKDNKEASVLSPRDKNKENKLTKRQARKILKKIAQDWQRSINESGQEISHRRTKAWRPSAGDTVKPKNFAIKDFQDILGNFTYIIKDVRPDMIAIEIQDIGKTWMPIGMFRPA